jgi:phage terminase small subunit
MSELTPKQEAFCLAYQETGVAATAYRKAYASASMSPASIHREAHELLKNPKITARLQELQARQLQKHDDKQKRWLEEIERISYMDPGDFFEWGPDGVTLKSGDALTPEQRRMVKSASETITQHGGTKRLQLVDRMAALEMLGRALGTFKPDNEQIGKAMGEAAAAVKEMGDLELARLIAFKLALGVQEAEKAQAEPVKNGADQAPDQAPAAEPGLNFGEPAE